MASLVRQIQDISARAYDVTCEDILGGRRTRSIVLARSVAIYVSRKVIKMSYPELGAAFKVDHSTALMTVRRIDRLMKIDPYLVEVVKDVTDSALRSDVARGDPLLLHVSSAEMKKLDGLIGTLWGRDRQEVAQQLLKKALMETEQ